MWGITKFTRRRLIAVVLLLVLCLFGLLEGVLAGAELIFPGGYPDPFAAYDAIMPGQPSVALSDYACHTQYTPDTASQTICHIRSEDDLFRLVTVTVEDNTIRQLSFYIRGLQVVDVIRHWGPPTTHNWEGRSYILHWGNSMFAFVLPQGGRFTYQWRVQLVSIGLDSG
jgi:VCBS repeat-containing protein